MPRARRLPAVLTVIATLALPGACGKPGPTGGGAPAKSAEKSAAKGADKAATPAAAASAAPRK